MMLFILLLIQLTHWCDTIVLRGEIEAFSPGVGKVLFGCQVSSWCQFCMYDMQKSVAPPKFFDSKKT